jgi:hypothetical protein
VTHRHSNRKSITRELKSASIDYLYRRPIVGLGLPEWHNPNMSILFSKTHLQKGFSFGPIVEEDTECVLNPLPIALPKSQIGLIF